MSAPADEGAQQRTIYRLAEMMIAGYVGSDLPNLSITARAYFDDPAVRHRVARSVLAQGWSRRQAPTAFDARLGPLTAQLTLVILNGVATGAFDSDDRWWRRRRLARSLRRNRARQGSATVVPVLPAAQAARIAGDGRRLARAAGLSSEEADRFAERLGELLAPEPG